MVDADEPPDMGKLPDLLEQLKDAINTSREATAEKRLKLAQEATALHQVYRQIIEVCVRILEQTIHGSVARGTKAKADYLATVAEGMSKKLEVQHGQLMSQLYSSDMQERLGQKSAELEKEAKSVKAKIREAEEELAEYRKAAGIQSMAQEYAEILAGTEKIKSEVARLKE
jgi:hypothetical protein